jgi:hypothetical protein
VNIVQNLLLSPFLDWPAGTMGSYSLPDIFKASYLKSDSYPENLIHKSTNTYPAALKAFKRRLNAVERDLFVDDDAYVEVPFRDLHNSSGQGMK